MRSAIFAFLLTLLAACALAVSEPQQAFIVSYPDNTPDSVMDEAKSAIKSAGGMITHEYHLIKAFAAKASSKTIETIQTLGEDHHAVVEEDKTYHTQDGSF